MSLSRKGGRGRLIGLDIGRCWVKALEFSSTGTGREIRGLARKELPPEMRQGERDPRVMADLIKACLAEGGISTKNVVVMVSGPQVFIRRIIMPAMPEKELAEVIPYEAAKYTSLPVEQLTADYVIVGEKDAKGVKNLDILLVAIPNDVIESEKSIVRAAGLKPVAVTVAPMVLWKTFQLSGQVPDGKVIAMLDIGFERATISLLNNGVLDFTRAINLGGDEITKSMTVPFVKEGGNLHTLTYDEAETIKQEYGLPPAEKTGATKDGVSFNQLSMLMRPVLERLLGEVRTSLDFYKTEFQIPRVDKIIMSGGGSMLKGLREFLVGDLGIEIELANPFQGSSFTGKMPEDNIVDAAPAFVMSLGLAAWEKSDIDLLGKGGRKAMKDSGPVKSLVAPGVVAVIIILLLYWNVSSKLAEARAELNQKTRELASLSPASATVLKLSSKKRKLEAELNSIPQALRESIDHARILEEVRLSTPDNTNLEQIIVASQDGKKMVHIWGTAFFMDERGASISDFMAVLGDSPLFDDVRMINAEDDKDHTKNGLKFVLSCQYNFTGG